MKPWLILLLAAALLVCAVMLPGGLLAQRERQLYGTVETRAIVSPRFEANPSTLSQRLQVLMESGNNIGDLYFSVGAGMYYDWEDLLEAFRTELDALAQNLPQVKAAWPEDPELCYHCVINPSTGDTYMLASLRNIGDTDYVLRMDMESGKLVELIYYGTLVGTAEEVEPMIGPLAEYLGLGIEALEELDGYGCFLSLGDGSHGAAYHIGMTDNGGIGFSLSA